VIRLLAVVPLISLITLIVVSLGACHRRPAPTGPPPTAAPPHDSLPAGWTAPSEPFRIAGNLYYVGSKNVASYLFTTPEGHILLDSGTAEMTPMVRRDIEKLGFAPAEIKVLLDSHAHFDHVGGHAALKRASGARVMVMRADAEAVASGVDRSPLGGDGWQPVAVDRVLDDGDTVTLGGTTLQAIAAPGHTPGCTVWTTRIHEPDKDYTVVFYGCARPNNGVPLLHNPRFPHLVDDTLATFRRMRTLSPDIVLTMHPEHLLAGTIDRIRAGARPHPLDDPGAWPKLLDETEAEFTALVERERAAAGTAK